MRSATLLTQKFHPGVDGTLFDFVGKPQTG